MLNPVFLDSNSGAPIHPTVMAALLEFLQSQSAHSKAGLGNPSSQHEFGRRAAELIDRAKEGVLATFQVSAKDWDVVFTSGGTEANQLAIRSVLEREGSKNPVWAVSPMEHSSVLEMIQSMRKRGVEVRVLEAKTGGEIIWDTPALAGATLISTMGVNNETGTVQDLALLTSHIQSGNPSSRTLVHVDFVPGWGKTELDLSATNAPDLVSIAGYKLGGISGVGALIHRKSISIDRKGTKNLLGIRSLLALTENWATIRKEVDDTRKLRDAFERDLKLRFPRVEITGERGNRAPHLSHFVFPGFSKNLSLVSALDMKGYAVSSGAACSSAVPEPSHVLLAMGRSKIDALNALRVSLHPGSKSEDLAGLLEALSAILKRYETD